MNRTERFGFSLRPDEKEAMRRLAEIEGGLSKAAFLRRLIHQAAEDHGVGVWAIQHEKEAGGE